MTDCGKNHHYLGLNVHRDHTNCTIRVDQAHFMKEILTHFRMAECKPVSTLFCLSIRLTIDRGNVTDTQTSEDIDMKLDKDLPKDSTNTKLDEDSPKDSMNRIDGTLYHQIVGSLMYLMIATRPDIATAVGIVSQFANDLKTEHLQAAKQIL